MSDAKLGTSIPYDTEKDRKVMDAVGIVTPVLDLVKKDPSVRKLIQDALTLTPARIEALNAHELRKYILVMPQALMHYQDCLARAINKLAEAKNEFDDVIAKPASLLTKEDFEKGVPSAPTPEMKLARMRELFPAEYAALIAKIRERQSIVISMEGQLDNIKIASDNLKKVFNTYYRATQSE